MMQFTENPLVTRIRAIAQHELAHFVAAIALGFEVHEVTLKLHPTEQVHRGKSRVNNIARCDNLKELREFMHRRAIVALAGVMGETISRSTLQLDTREAYQLLEHGETGAALDYAVAKELAQLLDNSSYEEGDGKLPARGAGSMKVFQEIFIHAASVVQINVRPVCALADMLAAQVKPSEGRDFIEATLTLEDVERTAAYREIQRISLSDLAG